MGLWTYRASLIEVIDADTIRVLVDQGLHGRQQEDLRLGGVRAPESDDPGGPEAAAFTQWWLAELPPMRWPLLIRTEPNTRLEAEERRSFVRYIASVWDIGETRWLNADLRAFLAEHPEWGPGE